MYGWKKRTLIITGFYNTVDFIDSREVFKNNWLKVTMRQGLLPRQISGI